MDWKDIAGVIGKTAPILGTLVGGPAGAAIGGIIGSILGTGSSPDAITNAIATDPQAALKLAQYESDNKVKLEAMAFAHADKLLDADIATVTAVNTTMQAETKGEHWPTYTWRPFNGFVVGTMAFGCYFVLPLMHIPAPQIPTEVWLMFGGILGVASWFRGKAQQAQAELTPGTPDAKG